MSTNGSTSRIVITGMGAVTPLAHTWPETWQAMLAGQSAGRRVTPELAEDFPTKIAAGVVDFDPSDRGMDRKDARRVGTVTHFAWAATQEALTDAGLDLQGEDLERVGIDIGSAFGALDVLEEQTRLLLERGPRRIIPTAAPAVLISTTPCYVAIQHGILGPVNSQVTACATGVVSIGESARRLQRGEVDVMIAGGADSYETPLILAAFSRLGAMSTRNDDPAGACRPFCRTRDGLIMGEGATIMILETLEHAQARGARILAEIAGYSLTCDAFHLSAPDPTGMGAARAMRGAMREAGVTGKDIAFIAAHGTGTPLNDVMETAAIKIALGEAAYDTRISSNKSMLGHMMGAAGAVSAASLVAAIQDHRVPPTINYHERDPECDLSYVPNVSEARPVDVAMCNAFGFGGQNASMVIRRFEG